MTAAPEGRKLLRLEIRNAETPIERKPEWIKTKAKMGPEYTALHSLVKSEDLHTVCQEAGCPNIYECWEDREATFLIGGSQCTRRCDFCQIDTGKPADYDTDEPRRVAESVVRMNLRYATVTSVARDDLPDTGAWLNAETVRKIHELNPNTGVELLANEHNADPAFLGQIFDARPEVFAHNVETVPRIFKRIRPAFRYERSLDVLTQARNAGLITKSNLILGMGEEPEEVVQRLNDLFGLLAHAEDEVRLGDQPRRAALGEHVERPLVAECRADALEDARDRLDVVREHLGARIEDLAEVGGVAAVIVGEQLDPGVRVLGVDLADGLGVQPSSRVGKVITSDAGDSRIAQSHPGDALGDPTRLVGVVVGGLAGVDLAEIAAASAL